SVASAATRPRDSCTRGRCPSPRWRPCSTPVLGSGARPGSVARGLAAALSRRSRSLLPERVESSLAWARPVSSDCRPGATPPAQGRYPTKVALHHRQPQDLTTRRRALPDMAPPRDDQPSTRPLLDKLGVRPGMRVATVGAFLTDFLTPLRSRAAEVVTDPAGCDIVLLAAEDRAQLAQVARLTASLRRDAALWIVRPRGSSAISERETLAAGLEAGLVDVKVVHFSETHSAAKFVYRLRDR